MKARLFRGGSLEVAAGPSGEILAVGPEARAAAGRDVEAVELRGTVWPGLQDAHLHLSPMAVRRLGVDLTSARSLEACLARIRKRAEGLPRQSPYLSLDRFGRWAFAELGRTLQNRLVAKTYGL